MGVVHISTLCIVCVLGIWNSNSRTWDWFWDFFFVAAYVLALESCSINEIAYSVYNITVWHNISFVIGLSGRAPTHGVVALQLSHSWLAADICSTRQL